MRASELERSELPRTRSRTRDRSRAFVAEVLARTAFCRSRALTRRFCLHKRFPLPEAKLHKARILDRRTIVRAAHADLAKSAREIKLSRRSVRGSHLKPHDAGASFATALKHGIEQSSADTAASKLRKHSHAQKLIPVGGVQHRCVAARLALRRVLAPRRGLSRYLICQKIFLCAEGECRLRPGIAKARPLKQAKSADILLFCGAHGYTIFHKQPRFLLQPRFLSSRGACAPVTPIISAERSFSERENIAFYAGNYLFKATLVFLDIRAERIGYLRLENGYLRCGKGKKLHEHHRMGRGHADYPLA